MAEGLGEVSKVLAGFRINLLSIEADIVGAGQQLFEASVCLVEATDTGQGLNEPEGADDERSFWTGKAIRTTVAVEEVAMCQFANNRLNCANDPRVVRSEKDVLECHPEQCGIRPAARHGDKSVAGWVDAVRDQPALEAAAARR